MVGRLEHIDAVPCWILDTKGAAEGFIGRLTHDLNTFRNKCSISSVRVVHQPPQFNTLVRRNASPFRQREYSAHASILLKLYKARLLILHDQAQLLRIESTSLLDIGYIQHYEIES